MPLKIIRSDEPITVDRLTVVVYGAPGVGKSTLAFTADRPLLLDFDRGAYRAANRRDSVSVERWEDVATISAADLSEYRTVVVDTAGRALDALTADIIRRNPKAGRGGALSLQGYGTLRAEFTAWLRMLNGFGLDVVLVAHMDEQKNGDDVMERLDVQGGSKTEIYKSADAMGRLVIRNGQRMLTFDPTDAAFGKNPGRLDVLAVPTPDEGPAFLSGVIASIKERLNALTAEQTAARAWHERIALMTTPEHFNEALAEVKTAPKVVQQALAAKAKAAGLAYDKDAGAYKPKGEAKKPAPEPTAAEGDSPALPLDQAS